MDKHTAALASLLLGIGKIEQRAGMGPGDPRSLARSFSEQIFPTDINRRLASVLSPTNDDDSSWQTLRLAGELAAGISVEEETELPNRLQTVLSGLGSETRSPAYMPINPLTLSQAAIFPQEDNSTEDATGAYRRLWQALGNDAQRLASADSDLSTLIADIYYLLAQYGSNIPAGTGSDMEDVSLFDYSRVSAALACCLAELEVTTIERLAGTHEQERADDNTTVALLLEGDISGVQKFIYTITSRGATSALRGRSFYLQLLTDAVARFILRTFDLPNTNLIYAGGGHFYLLLPASAAQSLESLQSKLDRLFLHFHGGDLYCALGAASLTCADFASDRFGSTWRRAGMAVSDRKRRKFAELGDELFNVLGTGGDETRECQVCHYEGDDVEESQRDDTDASTVRKCELCRSLEELGRDLRDASAILLADTDAITSEGRTYSAILRSLGLAVAIRRSILGWTDLPNNAKRAVVLGIQGMADDSFVATVQKQVHCPVARGFRWTVNVSPLRSDGSRATFEDMQQASQGLKRLGVLRMDVDNLGTLFSEGIQRRDQNGGEPVPAATLARVAGLSSALSRYFEGWVGVLCRDVNERARANTGQEAVYSIYSGGDDLFIVGAWSVLPELAQRIRNDFGVYTSGHPALTISGGITLHGGKEPLAQAAESAGDALEAAKDLDGKDAITLFGQTLYWKDFPEVKRLQNELERYVEESEGNRSLLHILLDAYAQYRTTEKELRGQGIGRTWSGEQQIIWGPYMWRTLYLLRRLADRPQAAREEIEQLIDELRKEDFAGLLWLGLAARWTEALTRKSVEEDEERD